MQIALFEIFRLQCLITILYKIIEPLLFDRYFYQPFLLLLFVTILYYKKNKNTTHF